MVGNPLHRSSRWRLSLAELFKWQVLAGAGMACCTMVGKLWLLLVCPMSLIAVLLVTTRFQMGRSVALGVAVSSVSAGLIIMWDNHVLQVHDPQAAINAGVFFGLLGGAISGSVHSIVKRQRVGLAVLALILIYALVLGLLVCPV